MYEVTADEAGETQEKLRKTFAELQIDDIKSPSGWISNMVRDQETPDESINQALSE